MTKGHRQSAVSRILHSAGKFLTERYNPYPGNLTDDLNKKSSTAGGLGSLRDEIGKNLYEDIIKMRKNNLDIREFNPSLEQPEILRASIAGSMREFRRDVPGEYNAYLVSKALQFDSDYVPDVPVYYNPELINYYVIRLQMYYSYLAALKVVSPLHRALDFIAKEINHNQFGIFLKESGEDQDNLKRSPISEDELRKDPRLSFFNNTDENGDFRDFLLTFNQHYFTCGNLYVIGDQKFKTGEGYKSFVVLPPQFVTVELGMDNRMKFYRYRPGVGTGIVNIDWNNTRGGIHIPGGGDELLNVKDVGLNTELVIPPTRIIHLRRSPNALLPYYGVGVVEANEALFQMYLVQNRKLQHWIENSHTPQGFLECVESEKGARYSPGEIEDKAAELEARISGKFNTGRLGAIPPGLRYVKADAASPESLIATTEYLERAILQLFNLPTTLWAKSGQDLPRYNNLAELTQTCRETIIKDAQDSIKIVCNKILQQQGLGDKYCFDFIGDAEFTADELRKDVATGNITRNTYALLRGLPKSEDPNADILLIPNNLIPISMSGVRVTAGAEELGVDVNDVALSLGGGGAKGVAGSPPLLPTRRKHTAIPMSPRVPSWRDGNSGGWVSEPAHGVWKAKEAKKNAKKIREDMLRLQRATVKRHTKRIADRLEKHLGEVALEVMTGFVKHQNQLFTEAQAETVSVKKDRGANDIGRQVRNFTFKIYDADDDAAVLQESIEDGYDLASADAIKNQAGVLTIAVSKDSMARISKYVNLGVEDRAVRMSKTTRDMVEESIKGSMRDGESWGGAANRLYKDLTGSLENFVDPETGAVTGTLDTKSRIHDRAECIARTEMGRAYDRASSKMFRDLNVAKSYMVIGCEDNETDCNATGILPDELDSLEFHPNHTGTIVVEEFSDDFGEAEEEPEAA